MATNLPTNSDAISFVVKYVAMEAFIVENGRGLGLPILAQYSQNSYSNSFDARVPESR